MKLWIITPVYYDTESFLILREKVKRDLSQTGTLQQFSVKFVVVDDSGGSDHEIDSLQSLEDVKVLSVPFNLGPQRAIVYGVRMMSLVIEDKDFVITMDSDGEDQPEDMPRLLEMAVQESHNIKKVVMARRTKRKESLQFKVLYFCFKILFRSLTGTIIRTGSYAVYRGWTSKNVLFHPHFDLCYASSLISLNLDLAFVPCERGPRYRGKSHMNYTKLITHGFRMLMPFLDRVAVRTLVMFSITFFICIFISLSIIYAKFFTGWPVPNWLTYLLLMMFVITVVIASNFIVIFAIFAQSQGLSLQGIEAGRKSNS